MRYWASKYSVTLKTGLGVVQGHWKWRRSINHIRLTILVRHCKYSSIWYSFFSYLTLNDINDLEIWVRGHSRSFKLVPFESLGAVSDSPSILHRLRDKARYWSRIVIFFICPLHSTPPFRGFPSEYCRPVWCGTRSPAGAGIANRPLVFWGFF